MRCQICWRVLSAESRAKNISPPRFWFILVILPCANKRTERRRVAEIIISRSPTLIFHRTHIFYPKHNNARHFPRGKSWQGAIKNAEERSAKKVRSRYSALVALVGAVGCRRCWKWWRMHEIALTLYTHTHGESDLLTPDAFCNIQQTRERRKISIWYFTWQICNSHIMYNLFRV